MGKAVADASTFNFVLAVLMAALTLLALTVIIWGVQKKRVHVPPSFEELAIENVEDEQPQLSQITSQVIVVAEKHPIKIAEDSPVRPAVEEKATGTIIEDPPAMEVVVVPPAAVAAVIEEKQALDVGLATPSIINDDSKPAQLTAPPTTKRLRSNPRMQKLIGEKILSSDIFMYTSEDIPFFNEPVADFRKRAQQLYLHGPKRTVFVALGSFRDDLCPDTIVEMFEKASAPFNVFVGLVDQVNLVDDSSDDIACDAILDERFRRQVRLVRLDPKLGAGPTHARYIASKLYQGEEFYMQIDS